MRTGKGSEEERRVLVVGIGDDGPAGLSPGLLDRVMRADLLAGGRRHLDLFDRYSGPRLTIAGGLEAVFGRIAAAVAEGSSVVVLASGDPCYYGIGPLLAARLGRSRVEIVPAVSSVALAFARLGVSWHDATVVSAHGRPLDRAVQGAVGASKLAVLTDDTNTPAAVAGALLAAGAGDAPAWVFEHLGGEHERAAETTLTALSGQGFAPLNVLVVPSLAWEVQDAPRPPAPPQCLTGFGRPEADYEHSAGLITKPEIRAVSLSKLRPRPGGVLWDVGAGSGSVAIEAAGLVPGLLVYAVERSTQQRSMLQRNIATFGQASQIRVVAGEAPDVLAGLPDPDAVFVGGSGGRLVDILDVAQSRVRLGGRIVLNLVTFEHLTETLAWARNRGLQPEVVQVSVARGADILGMTRLQAENPVTVVTLAT